MHDFYSSILKYYNNKTSCAHDTIQLDVKLYTKLTYIKKKCQNWPLPSFIKTIQFNGHYPVKPHWKKKSIRILIEYYQCILNITEVNLWNSIN